MPTGRESVAIYAIPPTRNAERDNALMNSSLFSVSSLKRITISAKSMLYSANVTASLMPTKGSMIAKIITDGITAGRSEETIARFLSNLLE